jgi:hypothetical protein
MICWAVSSGDTSVVLMTTLRLWFFVRIRNPGELLKNPARALQRPDRALINFQGVAMCTRITTDRPDIRAVVCELHRRGRRERRSQCHHFVISEATADALDADIAMLFE